MEKLLIFIIALAGQPATVAKAADAVTSPTVDVKVTEPKRVHATYWRGGYVISVADAPDPELVKKKPATKPVNKK